MSERTLLCLFNLRIMDFNISDFLEYCATQLFEFHIRCMFVIKLLASVCVFGCVDFPLLFQFCVCFSSLFANWRTFSQPEFFLSSIKIRLKPIRFVSQTFTLCGSLNGVRFFFGCCGWKVYTHKQPCFEIQCYTAMDHRYMCYCVNVSINSVERYRFSSYKFAPVDWL